MLFQCWSTVASGGPALKQGSVNVSQSIKGAVMALLFYRVNSFHELCKHGKPVSAILDKGPRVSMRGTPV